MRSENNQRNCVGNEFIETLRPLFDPLPHIVFLKGFDLKYIYVNQTCLNFFKKSESDIIGASDFNLFSTAMATELRNRDDALINGDSEYLSGEVLLADGDGRERWFLTTKQVVKSNTGEILGVWGLAVDITERKTASAELDLLEPAINQTSDAIVIVDLDGTIRYVNPAFENLTGYSIDEAVGAKPSILKSGKHSDEFYKELWETITSGRAWSGHFINRRKDGSKYEEDATISPVLGKDGEISHFIGVKKDVTKLVELETKIRQSQKMEAVGRLAGGVAHDFNNILTAILGYSEILLGMLPEKDPVRKKVEEIKKAGLRASDITKQMLAFSKKQVMRLTPQNVNDIINGMLSMLEEIVGSDVEISLNLNSELPDVNSDKTHIERIVMNLVVNAVDAMKPDGGNVAISTAVKEFSMPFSDGNFTVSPGKYVVISVADGGCGISDDVLEHIFEPFFTSKGGEQGTGLGLSTVYGIVKQHKGLIRVSSKLGEGSRFDVMIPVASPKDSVDLTDTIQEDGVKGPVAARRTLLVVDDETALLDMMFETLSEDGYNVLKASSGSEALEQFLQRRGKVDLVVTDIILHGMSGIELTEEILKTSPDMPVIFISGYAGGEFDVSSLESDSTEFLPKPFVMDELEERISRLLRRVAKKK